MPQSIFENGDLFFQIWLPSTRNQRFRGTEFRRFLITLTKVEIFENFFFFPYLCGRTKTKVFKDDDVGKISVFENTRLRVEGQIRFENARCVRRLFKYRKKASVLEITRLRVEGAQFC